MLIFILLEISFGLACDNLFDTGISVETNEGKFQKLFVKR